MSYPNQAQLEDEWFNTTMNIKVTIPNVGSIDRNYIIKDGQTPEVVAVGIQEMVDSLLDTSEL